jgi:hypothetical protein
MAWMTERNPFADKQQTSSFPKMSSSSFPVNAFATAILKDCDTILENYKNYPNSCHAANARFILDKLFASKDRDGNLSRIEVMFVFFNCIVERAYNIQGKSQNEAVDGPASLAYCANVKDAFVTDLQNLIHKPYEAVWEYAKGYGYILFKTYSESVELQTNSTIRKSNKRLEVKVYRGLNIRDEFVQQVDCYRNGILVATAKI